MNGLALAASGWMLTKWYPLLKALSATEDYATCLGIPNQTVLGIIGIKVLLVAFSVLLFCAFMSTCVTLVYTMIQRFEGKLFPKAIKVQKVREILVGFLRGAA